MAVRQRPGARRAWLCIPRPDFPHCSQQ